MSELVMIVDDEPGILTTLSSVLSDEGFETVCTKSGDEAVALYRDRSPAVVFLDIWLPDRDGLEALQDIRELDPTAADFLRFEAGPGPFQAEAHYDAFIGLNPNDKLIGWRRLAENRMRRLLEVDHHLRDAGR